MPDLDIAAYGPLLDAALAYAGGSHTRQDVLDAIDAGTAQFWPGPHSCIVTEIDEQPRHRVLHFFLAAGTSPELEAMESGILAWGQEQGCTVARFVGRKGWTRSFLARTGWADTGVVVMEKQINGQGER